MSFLAVFFICMLVLLVLEPKVIGTIFYVLFLLGVGFIAFWAFIFWLMSL
jgi:hypothetical protein